MLTTKIKTIHNPHKSQIIKMYLELLDIGEVYDTMKLQEMICEVHKELSDATKYKLNKEMINYDIPTIISEQDHKHKKYQEKIRELW